ncbi:conserved hypothetical [Prochlorococcus marinus str. MIT 9313]|jgi:hypothetical protein|nr:MULTISPECIES: hypothetical protein [Prochlorococcus]MEC7382105.1 hypothetical protein [Cyanobacteriota bacterium]RPF99228.1 MAG: hypothetical protein CBD83_004020 [Prochlorococcus sp. TMED223]RZO50954.1 MAG: hypothetical protein EVA79_04845 [Prochlorococcus sp. MED-G132]KZR63903.1 hypothetical protein PMIT1306_00871 [Prochlorococcus sp. MIT 1306]KZR67079.1 hypothetical protein PMIT1312_00603 [Prochlorococcus marinus str. MIT 1312]|tara:strand:+ start:482 stop:748 length:267 start_codon:yes stop_codon:yes gene_type:complete
MRYLPALIVVALASASDVKAQSSLLESVKNNPGEARELCSQFKALNTKGVSAYSSQAISEVARQRNLSSNNAEILATYVIGMNCPDVR